MCGFAGVLGPARDREALVRAMTAAIRHRGPDGQGFWRDQHCELGHARLAVIDLSPAGGQPMTNEDGSVVVVYNGEVYNFKELRSALESRGHSFKSRTDTEVLVHLYEDVGDRCADVLNGMFAFALWDARRKRLMLARDRFGQKPLFYATVGDSLIFGSEIKALLEHPELPRTVSDRAVDGLLTLQFVPSPDTFYEHVRRLEPGTVLVREIDGNERRRRIWVRTGARRCDVRFEEAAEEVESLLGKSIQRQLVADVPVGVFLSGGIDSSLVLAGLADRTRSDIEAYCLGFDNQAYDESPYARLTAVRFGVRLHELRLTADDFAGPERVVEMFDEPFADVAALPTEALCRAARSEITVALTGDGGDELFGGYDYHVLAYWLAHTDRWGELRRSAATTLARLVPTRTKFRSHLRTLRRGLSSVAHERWLDAYLSLRATLGVDARESLYTPEFHAAVADADPYQHLLPLGRASPSVEQLFDVAHDRVLGDLFLHKTDIASMSVGLECRSPFLDVPLAEFAATLPLEHFVRGLHGKHLLRHLLERRAGPRLARRRKQGFSPPLDDWLRRRLGESLHDLVLRPGAAVERYVRRDRVEQLYHEHVDHRADHRRLLWTLLLLESFLARARSSTRRASLPEVDASTRLPAGT